MVEKPQDYSPPPVEDHCDRYEVCVEGHLEPGWAEWFDGLTLTHLECGETLLCGPVADQAALHGILAQIRNLNLKLIFLKRVENRLKSQTPTEPGQI